MSGPQSEYQLQDCPMGQKDRETGDVLKVSFDYQGRCESG